jgi:tetratricopeptide (TPR) repeat protein
MRIHITILLTLLTGVSASNCAIASGIDHAERWVGRRVIKKPGPTLQSAGVQQHENAAPNEPTENPFRLYRVERVDGDRLWLVAETEGVRDTQFTIVVKDGLLVMLHGELADSGEWASPVDLIPLDRAIDFMNERVRLSSCSANYVDRGLLWAANGDADRAIADFGRAIKSRPMNAFAYNDRGVAWASKGEYEKAIADYTRAIKLDPRYAVAYANRGKARLRAKQEYDQVIADYEEAVRIDPEDVSTRRIRATLRSLLQKEHDKAIVELDELIRLRPGDPTSYSMRGMLRRVNKQYEKAIADYTEAIRICPTAAVLYADRGGAWLAKGETDRAKDDFDRAIHIDPKMIMAYFGRGAVRVRRGEYDKALADFERATGIDSHFLFAKALELCLRADDRNRSRLELAVYVLAKMFAN